MILVAIGFPIVLAAWLWLTGDCAVKCANLVRWEPDGWFTFGVSFVLMVVLFCGGIVTAFAAFPYWWQAVQGLFL